MDETAARSKFGSLYDLHGRAVLAYCTRRATSQDAQDAFNETFATVWRRIAKAPEPDAALPWLYSTARGVLSNQRRSSKRFARLISKTGSLAAPPEPGPELQVVRRQESEDVASAIDRLRPDDQELLRLHIWEELPHAAIGEAFGISESAVSQRLSRALKRLTAQVNRSARPSPHRIEPERGTA